MEFRVKQLSEVETKFAQNFQAQIHAILHPIPFLLIFPKAINRKNIEKVNNLIRNTDFLEKASQEGISRDIATDIINGIISFEIFKRATLMRLQWFLEIICLVIITVVFI